MDSSRARRLLDQAKAELGRCAARSTQCRAAYAAAGLEVERLQELDASLDAALQGGRAETLAPAFVHLQRERYGVELRSRREEVARRMESARSDLARAAMAAKDAGEELALAVARYEASARLALKNASRDMAMTDLA